jgi:hypothetical protein
MDFFSVCFLTVFVFVGIVVISKILDYFFQSDDPWKDPD